MLTLEHLWDHCNRFLVLVVSAAVVVAIAVTDGLTKPDVSVGFLYLFPIMLAAGYLPRWTVGLLGLGGAGLAETFGSLRPSCVRMTF